MMETPLRDGLFLQRISFLDLLTRILLGMGCAQRPIHKFTYSKIPPITQNHRKTTSSSLEVSTTPCSVAWLLGLLGKEDYKTSLE